MEYLEHGDLQEYLDNNGPLPEQQAGEVTYQILEGLDFMHQNEFTHRDLKPAVSWKPLRGKYQASCLS